MTNVDLFGFKRRRAEREAKAARRAAALEKAAQVMRDRPAPPPPTRQRRDVIGSYPEPRRRHRPEADAPDHLTNPLYPFSSAYADPTPTPAPAPDTTSHHHTSHDFGAAGSGIDFNS